MQSDVVSYQTLKKKYQVAEKMIRTVCYYHVTYEFQSESTLVWLND